MEDKLDMIIIKQSQEEIEAYRGGILISALCWNCFSDSRCRYTLLVLYCNGVIFFQMERYHQLYTDLR